MMLSRRKFTLLLAATGVTGMPVGDHARSETLFEMSLDLPFGHYTEVPRNTFDWEKEYGNLIGFNPSAEMLENQETYLAFLRRLRSELITQARSQLPEGVRFEIRQRDPGVVFGYHLHQDGLVWYHPPGGAVGDLCHPLEPIDYKENGYFLFGRYAA